MHFQHLTERSLVRICGEDAEHFLENLVTCKITGLKTGDAEFGALLTPQGKILFDFFVIKTERGFLFDTPKSLAEDFVKRLGFYKLRAKVVIDQVDNLSVFAVWESGKPQTSGLAIADPRLPEMGWRIYSDTPPDAHISDYLLHRIKCGMPDGGKDFAYGEAFPHETLMDQFGGVDFRKGCYVGQEVVSRMQHRGTARKRIITVSAQSGLPETGTPITADERPVGTIGSVSGNYGLAIVRLDRVAKVMTDHIPIVANGIEVTPAIQEWADFDWPDSGKT